LGARFHRCGDFDHCDRRHVVVNVRFTEISDRFPFLGAAVWLALLLCVPLRRPHWEELPGAFKGSIFLLSLVLAASMMPVETLPMHHGKSRWGWDLFPPYSTIFH
jgi:hypothetical protein